MNIYFSNHTVYNSPFYQVAAKLLKGILIRVAATERERLLKQREDVLKRYSEQKKRQEEEQKMVEEDKVRDISQCIISSQSYIPYTNTE